jgi:hypothetical protein
MYIFEEKLNRALRNNKIEILLQEILCLFLFFIIETFVFFFLN